MKRVFLLVPNCAVVAQNKVEIDLISHNSTRDLCGSFRLKVDIFVMILKKKSWGLLKAGPCGGSPCPITVNTKTQLKHV